MRLWACLATCAIAPRNVLSDASVSPRGALGEDAEKNAAAVGCRNVAGDAWCEEANAACPTCQPSSQDLCEALFAPSKRRSGWCDKRCGYGKCVGQACFNREPEKWCEESRPMCPYAFCKDSTCTKAGFCDRTCGLCEFTTSSSQVVTTTSIARPITTTIATIIETTTTITTTTTTTITTTKTTTSTLNECNGNINVLVRVHYGFSTAVNEKSAIKILAIAVNLSTSCVTASGPVKGTLPAGFVVVYIHVIKVPDYRDASAVVAALAQAVSLGGVILIEVKVTKPEPKPLPTDDDPNEGVTWTTGLVLSLLGALLLTAICILCFLGCMWRPGKSQAGSNGRHDGTRDLDFEDCGEDVRPTYSTSRPPTESSCPVVTCLPIVLGSPDSSETQSEIDIANTDTSLPWHASGRGPACSSQAEQVSNNVITHDFHHSAETPGSPRGPRDVPPQNMAVNRSWTISMEFDDIKDPSRQLSCEWNPRSTWDDLRVNAMKVCTVPDHRHGIEGFNSFSM